MKNADTIYFLLFLGRRGKRGTKGDSGRAGPPGLPGKAGPQGFPVGVLLTNLKLIFIPLKRCSHVGHRTL